ncbi:MAG: hypothetical protein M3R55_04685 [Acidobacteriota bacterium]|nr:hypothetical protein [Acidobacteriota bacterium]
MVSVAAQRPVKGGSQPPPLVPVSAAFRCPLADDCPSSTRIDRISGDMQGPYLGNAQRVDGAYLNENTKLYFHLSPAYGRTVELDFQDQADTAPCLNQGTCRKTFVVVRPNTSDPASITNPLDASGEPLPNGFADIAVGQSARARFMFNFPDPMGRPLLWTVRFNAEFYPGSSDVTVSRTAENTWVIEASGDDVAELVAVPTGKGKMIMTHEGFYTMPFRITVTR